MTPEQVGDLLASVSSGKALYGTRFRAANDEILYLIVEETAPPLDVDLAFQIVLMRSKSGRNSRDRVITEIGSENRQLVGDPPDWTRVCGLAKSNSKSYFYVVAGSFGNRFMIVQQPSRFIMSIPKSSISPLTPGETITLQSTPAYNLTLQSASFRHRS